MAYEDFYESAIRHWIDGSILEENEEYDNAVVCRDLQQSVL
jgi:hypothetical protein